jgi:hypothetical protein
LINIDEEAVVYIPPPKYPPEFPLKVQLVSVGEDELL